MVATVSLLRADCRGRRLPSGRRRGTRCARGEWEVRADAWAETRVHFRTGITSVVPWLVAIVSGRLATALLHLAEQAPAEVEHALCQLVPSVSQPFRRRLWCSDLDPEAAADADGRGIALRPLQNDMSVVWRVGDGWVSSGARPVLGERRGCGPLRAGRDAGLGERASRAAAATVR
jgi:hypothetical protein